MVLWPTVPPLFWIVQEAVDLQVKVTIWGPTSFRRSSVGKQYGFRLVPACGQPTEETGWLPYITVFRTESLVFFQHNIVVSLTVYAASGCQHWWISAPPYPAQDCNPARWKPDKINYLHVPPPPKKTWQNGHRTGCWLLPRSGHMYSPHIHLYMHTTSCHEIPRAQTSSWYILWPALMKTALPPQGSWEICPWVHWTRSHGDRRPFACSPPQPHPCPHPIWWRALSGGCQGGSPTSFLALCLRFYLEPWKKQGWQEGCLL